MTFERTADTEIRTERLTLREAADSDAQEAYELITHPKMRFVDIVPESPDHMRASIERGRSEGAEPNLIHHEWAVRSNSDDTLVAFASCNAMRRGGLEVVAGEAREVEHRAVEPTIYVHPDHQGQGYGPEAIEAIEQFAVQHYGVTESRPKIDPSNEKSRTKTAQRGATRELPAGLYDPLETWSRRLE